MKKYLLCTALLMSTVSFAKVDPKFEELRDAQIECDIVSATQVENGKVTRSLKNTTSVMTTLVQDGGEEYTDAKCFRTPVINEKGEDSVMSFGCIPLESKYVKKFNSKQLLIKRNEFNEIIRIDFESGKGSYSLEDSGCDWGRKCFTISSEVEYKNCVIK